MFQAGPKKRNQDTDDFINYNHSYRAGGKRNRKEIKGLHNFKENKIVICTENAKRKTKYKGIKNHSNKDNFKIKSAIRKALRHEATHVVQKCNGNKTVGDIKNLENKLHQSKRKALEFSTSKFSGTYSKEVEAYILEDKPRKVKEMLKKYCL